jgi:CHASE1-domain containing sensor protein
MLTTPYHPPSQLDQPLNEISAIPLLLAGLGTLIAMVALLVAAWRR